MSKPVRLNDDELSHIFEAARPLPVERRDAFLQEVASLLSGCDMVGPGTVHRAIQQAQRLYFDPPHNQPGPSRARWDRDRPEFERVPKQAV
jgi:hypothetical protein